MNIENKIFYSKKQRIIGPGAGDKTVKGLRKICIENGNFIIDLPSNKVLSGNLSLHSNDDVKTVYMTNNGCPFVLNHDNTILLNLGKTHDYAIVYYLEKEPSENVNQEKSFWRKLWNK